MFRLLLLLFLPARPTGLLALALLAAGCARTPISVSDRPETPFKLVTYSRQSETRVGLVLDPEKVVDLVRANQSLEERSQLPRMSLPTTMLALGDVIATGTPSGVGSARGIFLQSGDRVTATVEGIGSLENPVR